MPSSYQVVLWKQESFVVLRPLQSEFFRILLKGQRGYDPTRHQQSWRSAWRNMTRASGLPHVHFHDLRHTAITRGLEQGVNIGILKAIAGHMDARMVEYYSHIGSGVKRDAVDRIGETYGPVAQFLGLEDAGPESVN